MMEGGWTPGPWRFAGSGIVSVDNPPNLKTICLLDRPPSDVYEYHDFREWYANAKLITAAPDLHKALAHLVRVTGQWLSDEDYEIAADALGKAEDGGASNASTRD